MRVNTLENHSWHHAGQIQVRIRGKPDLFRWITQQGGLATAALQWGGQTDDMRGYSTLTCTNICTSTVTLQMLFWRESKSLTETLKEVRVRTEGRNLD